MQQLTGIERISNILNHKPVDRIGLYEHFWGDTFAEWKAQGKVKTVVGQEEVADTTRLVLEALGK